jgi:site-specific recombinase XerD
VASPPDLDVTVTVAPPQTLAEARRLLDQLPPSLRAQLGSSMMRDAVKDRSYRATPLGLEIARYYRWKKNEWGATADTLRDYEASLARLALFFADLDLPDFAPPIGTERLRECWEHHWGDRAPRTRKKVRSAWVDFFEWAVRERGLHGNPARALSIPKVRDTQIETFLPSIVAKVLSSQVYAADWLIADLILRYGVRRSGIVNAQLRDFDLERRLFTCRTKGGRIYEIPVVDEKFWLKLGELVLDAQLLPDHWLLFRQDTRRMKVPLDEATEVIQIGKTRTGYAEIVRRSHTVKPTPKVAHLRWYGILTNAGLVPKGTTGGMNMHRGRHTAATALQRSEHDLTLTKRLLGHLDIRSTDRYSQLDTHDLAAALSKVFEGDE